MDWRSVNFDWNRARAFLITAEEGSLSAAARALGMAQPTLGRQVAALEEELGVTLFERVGRGLELTKAGAALVPHMRAMGEAATAASLAAGGQSQSVEGNVAITATELYSSWLMPKVVRRLREIAPGISLEIVSANEVRDLKRREADIAIRNARPEDADLIGKLVAEDRGTFFASPDYLEKLGPLTDLGDLARAEFIGFGEQEAYVPVLQQFGIPVSKDQFPVHTNSHVVHWDMTRAGIGIGVGPCGMGDADPRLRRVFADKPSFDYPVWLVAHRELRTSPRVRLVWDLLAEMLPSLLRT
jgi:DNA-binding transcriptional LysR family regulator